jgi:hypothetical protein
MSKVSLLLCCPIISKHSIFIDVEAYLLYSIYHLCLRKKPERLSVFGSFCRIISMRPKAVGQLGTYIQLLINDNNVLVFLTSV